MYATDWYGSLRMLVESYCYCTPEGIPTPAQAVADPALTLMLDVVRFLLGSTIV